MHLCFLVKVTLGNGQKMSYKCGHMQCSRNSGSPHYWLAAFFSRKFAIFIALMKSCRDTEGNEPRGSLLLFLVAFP